MGWIEIEGMEFYAYHGHFKEEQRVGNRFLIDLKIKTNLQPPAVSDNLKDALDYQKVYQIIKNEMDMKSFLIENIGKRILDGLENSFQGQAEQFILKLSKINPPLGGKVKKVSIVMERKLN